jgi:biopolymer transport protein ExbB/TolQ
MIQNIMIVILLAALVASWVVIVLNLKAMRKLQKAADDLKNSIDVDRLSETVKKNVMKHVYIPLGYDRIKVFK